MYFSLNKKCKRLFVRGDKHWWLTGFKLGEFSDPSELMMHIKITLKDEIMRDAFIGGLQKAGYSKNNIEVYGNEVELYFTKPKTQQPITRNKEAEKLVQIKNKALCDLYQQVTDPYDDFIDKVNAIKKREPKLYKLILKIGKSIEFFKRIKKA